tara:strand:+ start:77 stop:1225 length:1149 start_codon:yes stop_codon:yes gene_type:complete
MKILLISPNIFSVYNFRLNLLNDLVKKGNKVTVLSPVKKTDKDYIISIKNKGIDILPIKLERNKINIFSDIYYLKSLVINILRLKPRLLLSYTIKPVIYSGIAKYLIKILRPKNQIYNLSMITGLGFIYSDVFNIKAFLLKPIITNLYRLGLFNTNNVIFQNDHDLNYFVNKKIVNTKKTKCSLIKGSGVDLCKFSQIPIPEKHTFLMTSRLLKDKGVNEYVEAAKIIKKSYPSTIFYLAGSLDSNPNSISQNQLKRWIDDGVINYLGFVSPIQKAIIKCRYFVLPSYYPEGLPRSILEAMASGRPIITTNKPGCIDTVLENQNGFLVQPRNVDNLVEKMLKLISLEGQIIQKMGRCSRELVKKNFEIGIINKQIIDLLPKK